MPEESLEVLMARMSERLKYVQEEMQKDREGRKHQYDKIEEVNLIVTKMDGRLESVEKSLAKASPTIEEFITIKHKVVGAGAAGKYIWAIAASMLTFVVASRDNIKTFFAWLLS